MSDHEATAGGSQGLGAGPPATTTAAATPAAVRRFGARDFAVTTLDPLVGHRALPMLGLALLSVFFLVRMAGAPSPLALAWTAVAAATAIASPALGLLLIAGIGPFTEAVAADGTITATPVLAVALIGSTAARWLATRAWPERSPALVLAVVIAVGTGLGVANTLRVFGQAEALESARSWLAGPASAFGLCLVAARVGGQGEWRPLAVAVGSAAAAALLSLVQHVLPALVDPTPLAALLRPNEAIARLTGVIPAPNASATIFLVPIAFLAAVALGSGDARARLAAAATALTILVPTLLTLSRSAALAVLALVALHAARIRRWLGLVIAAVGLVTAFAVVVGYGALRPDAADMDVNVVMTGDPARALGWTTGIRMWLDEPLLGHGFGSYELVHQRYGESVLAAPHNEWLRLFAEEGVLVGTAGVLFVVAAARTLWRAGGTIAMGGLGVLASYAVMASFNNPLTYIQVSVPVFVTLGVALGAAARHPPARHPMASHRLARRPAGDHRGTAPAGRDTAPNQSNVRDRPSSSVTAGS